VDKKKTLQGKREVNWRYHEAQNSSLRAKQGIDRRFTVATYNVHEWIGSDGRRDPKRILQVISRLEVDILALQEVSLSPEGQVGFRLEDLVQATGMRVVPGLTLYQKNSEFGNALLTVYPIQDIQRIELSMKGREPRGAIAVRVDIYGLPVVVIAAHLGLKSDERQNQIKVLLEKMRVFCNVLLILMGDFNEWNPFSQSLRCLRSHFGHLRAPATYPARFPILALDRILVCPRAAREEVRAVKTPLARIASDHLPLKAVVTPMMTVTQLS
jgi:endonuclease/exonuclease/phosphatase family metal-dependent hydrolase